MTEQKSHINVELYLYDNANIWSAYLNEYDKAVKLVSIKKKNQELIQLDKWLWNDLKKDVYDRYDVQPDNGYYLTKEELSNIMKWKLLRGTFRPLQKLVDSNSVDSVKLHTNEALNILCDVNNDNYNDWKKALNELIKLKGIGVATASIVLAVFAQHLCPFMSDEVIKAIYYNSKICYTNSVYVFIQAKLAAKMNIINAISNTIWTVEMLGKALWVADILNEYNKCDNVKPYITDKIII